MLVALLCSGLGSQRGNGINTDCARKMCYDRALCRSIFFMNFDVLLSSKPLDQNSWRKIRKISIVGRKGLGHSYWIQMGLMRNVTRRGVARKYVILSSAAGNVRGQKVRGD